MKFPRIPPEWPRIISEAAKKGRVLALLEASREEAGRADRYLHWDELRHKGGSGEVTAEELWAGLKMGRVGKAQPISLLNEEGVPFTFFLTQEMFQSLHEIDLSSGGAVSVPVEARTRDTRDRYYVSSLIEEALSSSQLEGAVVTRSEAKEMLRSKRKPRNSHERMVVNNFLTMQMLEGIRDRDLTPELIMEIHRRISEGTLEKPEDEGRLRTQDDGVRLVDEETGEVMYTPPPAEQLPDRLEKLCAFANDHEMTGYLHPAIRSILLHFWLAYEHPFVDGNGRTARALFYWSMLRHGFWLFEFVSISHVLVKAPKKYYRSFLHTETDGNDLNYFLIHQMRTLLAAMEGLHSYIARKKGKVDELRKLLSPGCGLNHRQLALVRHALSNGSAVYTVESHRTSHRIAVQTARTDLEGLRSKGLLVRSKLGNAFRYRPDSEIGKKLKELPEC